MSGWPVRLSPHAAKALAGLPEYAVEIVRDVLDIASRDPWSFPAFDGRDPEGEDVRSATIGQLAAVYFVNRSAGRLYVIDVVWLG
ncbi:type II toxin-antitoxin system RelE family toxin [Streptomyces sp. CA-243310]|uniref:type II toxin-antitoxin system RelE family toxin n=1 Tax=Streptomyces sp. CA-243310 TaxID=3240056 RepID=UPI003D90B800